MERRLRGRSCGGIPAKLLQQLVFNLRPGSLQLLVRGRCDDRHHRQVVLKTVVIIVLAFVHVVGADVDFVVNVAMVAFAAVLLILFIEKSGKTEIFRFEAAREIAETRGGKDFSLRIF